MIQLRAGALHVVDRQEGFRLDGQDAPARSSCTAGDLVEARLLTIDDAAHTATGTLEQTPLVEGAVLAIDNRTGQIRAMIGGYSFDRSKFNRATQAYRQVGSAFKPIVYTAAIDRGYTPTTIIMDTPASFPGGAGSPVYTPMNYDKKFEGPITLRRALEDSRNVPAVRVMEQLGPAHVIQYARRLGLQSPLPPYLAVALGAAEATLIGNDERVFGVSQPGRADAAVLDLEGLGSRRQRARGEPPRAQGSDPRRHGVRDDQPSARRRPARHRGKGGVAQLAARRQDRHDRRLHRRVVHRVRSDITIGVWVGLDQKKPIGSNMTGAEAALPIWMDIMKAWIGDRKEPPQFPPPGNIVFVTVDKGSGRPGGRRHAGRDPGSVHRRHAAGVDTVTVCQCSMFNVQWASSQQH